MVRPHCRACRYYDRNSTGVIVELCTHPSAKTFDRVYGYRRPILTRGLVSPDETLDKCDTEGWFEERKPKKWWKMGF